ncbi:MAG TPA: competence protein ComEC, partial [Alphaproteobacteria bacterium]|nr:competence protein ComEC [Alphaproteobacteria bacterium]
MRAILRRIGWGGLPLAIALPCAFGTGAMVYLTLPVEPVRLAVPMLACASVLFVAALVLARTRTALPLALLVLAFAIAGYARAEWRTHALDHTILADRDRARTVTGWIEDVQRSGPRERLVIRVATIEGVDAPPPRIRVTASRGEFGPGDAITLRAVLGPPPRPAAPGGYDSGFASWYAGIGGSGFAVSRPAEAEVAMDAGRRRFAAWRWSIAERVRAQMPARSGGVAAALLTGDRSGIDPDDAEALRAAGLGHILAISGLHMALMAGGVFFAVTAL